MLANATNALAHVCLGHVFREVINIENAVFSSVLCIRGRGSAALHSFLIDVHRLISS